MRKLVLCSLITLATAGCAPTEPPAMTAKQETDFQKVIEGRVAGPPQSCVQQRLLGGNKTYGEGVIVFEGYTSSGVIYVNRPPNGCPELSTSRALRTRTHTDQLCRNDIVTVFDPVNHVDYGSCGLGDFVPYRKE